MKNGDLHRPSEREAIGATAAAWLAQRDAGFSSGEAEEFARWRAADARHEAAVARLDGAWHTLQQLRDFRPEAQRHPDRDLLRTGPARRRVAWFPAFATAALAAALVLATAWWIGGSPRAGERTAQQFATTPDGYERVTLEDGSVLELNANSAVRVQFTTGERRVRLTRGEAHFTVAKNPARPFFVEAGGVAVRAIGTAFNVRLGERHVEVLVTEGRVQVADERAPAVVPPAVPVLTVNQRAVIATTRLAQAATIAPVVEQVAPEAVREALAWQGPRLVFVDTPLAEAIGQFNRRNQVQIELADASLAGLPIGGSFRAENVDAFVRLLAADNEIAVERRDATHIVLRKAK